MKKKLLLTLLILSFTILPLLNNQVYAKEHTHTKTVSIKNYYEQNGYLVVKWKKSKDCKAYCVHLNCGKKILTAKCVSKTSSSTKIRITSSLRRKMDKCNNLNVVVYCSNRTYKSSYGGGG